MSDLEIRAFLNIHRETISEILTSQRVLSSQDKSTAHGRIFQFVISLTTLSLTAWIGLVTWKFSALESQWCRVLSSCSLLIFATILMAISDFLIILQSKYVSESIEFQKKVWLNSYNNLEAKLVSMALGENSSSEKKFSALVEHFQEIQTPSENEQEKNNAKKIAELYKWSWRTGIFGFILFIVAVCYSIYQMPKFVETSRNQIKSDSAQQHLITKPIISEQ